MKNKILFLSFCTSVFLNLNVSIAQVGINTTTPADDSMLDITTTEKGLLIPRVDIADLSTLAPVTGTGSESLLVYNINVTTGKGFYYWNGTEWVAVGKGRFWELDGNENTNPGTGANENYIGTSDSQNFVIGTNAIERIAVDGNNGNVAVGTSTIPANTRLSVDAGVSDNAIFGYTTNVGGYLGREGDIIFGTNPTYLISGAGVYANNPNSGYTSVYAQSTGAADVAASISYSNVWIPNYNYFQCNLTSSPSGATTVYGQLNLTQSSLTGFKNGMYAYVNRGTISGNNGLTNGFLSQVFSQNEEANGIYNYVASDANNSAGGRFLLYSYGGTPRADVRVAARVGGTNYKIIGSGSVSTIVTDPDSKKRIMFAPEAPEILLQDYGRGELKNGKATINLDKIFSRNIHVDENHPLRVFIQLEGDCNGTFVTNKSRNGFQVKELNNGRSNVKFTWQVVANRADDVDEGGEINSKHQEVRFPELKEMHDILPNRDGMSPNSQNN